jgi:hypothetical protein
LLAVQAAAVVMLNLQVVLVVPKVQEMLAAT